MSAARRVKDVAVLGLGLMGAGIAQVTAQAGYRVAGIEATAEAAGKALDSITRSLHAVEKRAVAKGAAADVAAAATAATLSRITVSSDRSQLRNADLVIEAAPEDAAFKAKLYASLRAEVRADAIVATNTSGLLVGDLARSFGGDGASRVIGLHYFNPVPQMALCEVVTLPTTSPDVREAAMALVRAQNKTPVVAADTPGFIVNRLLVPFLAQAISLVAAKVATVPDIDAAMSAWRWWRSRRIALSSAQNINPT